MALEISRCSSTGFRCWAVAVVAGIVVVRGGRPVDTGNARRVASGRRRKIGGQVGKRDGGGDTGGEGRIGEGRPARGRVGGSSTDPRRATPQPRGMGRIARARSVGSGHAARRLEADVHRRRRSLAPPHATMRTRSLLAVVVALAAAPLAATPLAAQQRPDMNGISADRAAIEQAARNYEAAWAKADVNA